MFKDLDSNRTMAEDERIPQVPTKEICQIVKELDIQRSIKSKLMSHLVDL